MIQKKWFPDESPSLLHFIVFYFFKRFSTNPYLTIIKPLIYIILSSIFLFSQIYAVLDRNEKVVYPLTNDLIDVVIPAIKKDIETLELCIEGIKKNCNKVRRIIVVSNEKLTDKAEWFDEKKYPFDKRSIAFYLNGRDHKKGKNYLKALNTRVGWYYQQVLKLYAPFVIPEISSNVLVVDSDTVFFKPVDFISSKMGGNYATGSEFHPPYFDHMNKLLPGLTKLYEDKSGICHHMLFQKQILEDLFYEVEDHHQLDFWKIFCLSVNPNCLYDSGASEYEIYFNFAFARTNQVSIRSLNWVNSNDPKAIERHKAEGFDYVSYHAYLRDD